MLIFFDDGEKALKLIYKKAEMIRLSKNDNQHNEKCNFFA